MKVEHSITTPSTEDVLRKEIEELKARLEEAEETLRAIRHGEVDALLVSGPNGAQVFTLQSAEQPYRILIEQMQEGAVTLSEEGTILYCNLRFAQMLKRPHEKVLASSVQHWVSSTHAEQFAGLLRLGTVQSARAEITFCTGDAVQMPTYVTVSPLPAEVEGSICMIVTDLTEQESMRRSQAEIQALNTRLSRAMTETHHRVKNGLQIMSAFVDMQLLESEETVPISTLRHLNQQIHTLATVHEALTQQARADASGSTVSSKFLLQSLLSMLQQLAAPRKIKHFIDEARLKGRQPTSLALVVNELVLNALKHGKSDVEVTFSVQGEQACLEVSDDGEGLPAGFSADLATNTGLTLLENLVTWDLQGSIVFQNRTDRTGACAMVTFPL